MWEVQLVWSSSFHCICVQLLYNRYNQNSVFIHMQGMMVLFSLTLVLIILYNYSTIDWLLFLAVVSPNICTSQISIGIQSKFLTRVFLHSLEKSSSLTASNVFVEKVVAASLARNANVPKSNPSSVIWKVSMLMFRSIIWTPAAMNPCAVSVACILFHWYYKVMFTQALKKSIWYTIPSSSMWFGLLTWHYSWKCAVSSLT